MNKIVIYSFLLLIVLNACDDVDKLQLGETTTPVLTSGLSNEAIILTADNGEDLFSIFQWTKADFGYPSGDPEYVLEMDFAGNEFANAVNLNVSSELSYEVVNSYINRKLLTLGAVAGTASDVEFRVTGAIKQKLFASSNVLNANITPYEIVLVYPKLYVTGDQNAWAFDEENLLYSVSDNGIYEGYIHMSNVDNMYRFKMSYQPNWNSGDVIIGDADASGTSGVLQVGDWGGNDVNATEGEGVYYIKANIPALTYSIYKTNWAITGDFNSWGFADMIYDIDTGIWILTADMTAGGFKFIANQDWTKVKGDNEMDGILDKGTDENNITIEEDGNYTIALDLSQAIYTYTIVKN